MNRFLHLLCAGLIASLFLTGVGAAQDAPEPPQRDSEGSKSEDRPKDDSDRDRRGRPDYRGGPEGDKDEPELSSEEMRRIREVMGKVWDDPEVVAARKQVHEATEAYQQALQKAVAKADPEVVALVDKLHEGSRLRAHERKSRFGSRPGYAPRPKTPEEMVARTLLNDPALRGLEREQIGKLMSLAQEIRATGDLDEEIKIALKAEDPKDFGPARNRLREGLVSKLSEKEEWIRELFENAPPPHPDDREGGHGPRPDGPGPGGPGPGGPGPKGKGPGAGPPRPGE